MSDPTDTQDPIAAAASPEQRWWWVHTSDGVHMATSTEPVVFGDHYVEVGEARFARHAVLAVVPATAGDVSRHLEIAHGVEEGPAPLSREDFELFAQEVRQDMQGLRTVSSGRGRQVGRQSFRFIHPYLDEELVILLSRGLDRF